MYKVNLTEEDWVCSGEVFSYHNRLPVSKGLLLVEVLHSLFLFSWIFLAQDKRGLSRDDKSKKDTFTEPSPCAPKPP